MRPIFVPPPADVWKAFLGMYTLLPRAILTTVAMTLTGFGIGVAFGTISGLAMAYSKTVRDYLGALFDFTRPVPVFALIPLFILWFGIGQGPADRADRARHLCRSRRHHGGGDPQRPVDLHPRGAHARARTASASIRR